MTTEEIIEWVDGAISVREDSFIPNEGRYSLSNHQVLQATRPENAKEYDDAIAMWMIDYSNDVTDWMEQINLQNQMQKV